SLEVADLDLTRTELAVLSACSTGLGKAQEGEGVLGLQRAFQLAGVQTTLTSLWAVPDDATEALMVEFYRNLWERQLSRLESLRQAQIALLEGKVYRPREADANAPKRLPPYHWAAFVLSGSW